jgi:hypothetical protein
MKETITVRSSSIYEINGNRLVLAQTEPPFADVHREIVVTYLADDMEDRRQGITARIEEIIAYRLAGQEEVQALVAVMKGQSAPFSLRMFHRVQPTDDSRLSVRVDGVEVDILDISLRGVRFKYRQDLSLEAGRVVAISLNIGFGSFSLEGCITRTWGDDEFPLWKEPTFASVEFVNIGAMAERTLLRKIHQIEREWRRREQGGEGEECD